MKWRWPAEGYRGLLLGAGDGMKNMAAVNLKNSVERYKRMQIVVALATAAAGLSFWLLDYRPGAARMAALADQIHGQQEELDLNLAQANNLPAVAAEVSKLKTRLTDSKRLPSDPQLGEFIRDINALSQTAQLKKLRVTRGAVMHDDLYCSQPITIDFEGDFLSAFTFIREVEDMSRLTRIESLSIHQLDAATGQVSVELCMDIYYREDPQWTPQP